MTMRRWTPLTLLMLAFAAAPASATRQTLNEQSERAVEAGGLSGLEVSNPRGDTEVRVSADGRIHLKALKIVHAPTEADARTLAENTRVEAEASGGRYQVRVIYPQRHTVEVGFWDFLHEGGFTMPEAEVRLTIDVPAGFEVRLATTSGDLDTQDIGGRQTLQTVSGDVSVRGARGALSVTTTSGSVEGDFVGPARLRTVSGDITIASVQKALDGHTTSGDLVIRDAADSLTLGSVSGDIQVARAPRGLTAVSTSGGITARAVAGACVLGTSSGDVDVTFDPRLARAEVSSGSGDLKARLPSRLGATLEMRTSNGSIDVTAPLAVKNVTRRSVTGRVGGGEIPITLRSSSGDIQILSGGD